MIFGLVCQHIDFYVSHFMPEKLTIRNQGLENNSDSKRDLSVQVTIWVKIIKDSAGKEIKNFVIIS